jgi:signal transduction histidine kinase
MCFTENSISECAGSISQVLATASGSAVVVSRVPVIVIHVTLRLGTRSCGHPGALNPNARGGTDAGPLPTAWFNVMRVQCLSNELVGSEAVLGLVVHELRTPVTIIKAYAELLEAYAAQERAPPAGSREIMTHILQQADLMSNWVETLLDVDRLELSELPLELARVDLVQLAWTVAEDVQQTTKRHHIRVLTSTPAPSPVVADRSRLQQVLSNLLDNAIKYSAGGTIQMRLGVQAASNKAIVAVHDEGTGLAGDELDRVFGRFEQAQPTSIGLGVGLYLARQIARMHGGELWAESRGRMSGSTFVLALPMGA